MGQVPQVGQDIGDGVGAHQHPLPSSPGAISPLSFSPNMVRNTVKLIGPGASFIISSISSFFTFRRPRGEQLLVNRVSVSGCKCVQTSGLCFMCRGLKDALWEPFPGGFSPPEGSGTDLGSHHHQGTAVAEVRKGESCASRGRVGWTSPALVSQAPGSQKRGLQRTELCCFLPLPHCPMDQPASALLGRCFGAKPRVLWFPLAPSIRNEQD